MLLKSDGSRVRVLLLVGDSQSIANRNKKQSMDNVWKSKTTNQRLKREALGGGGGCENQIAIMHVWS